MIEIDQRKRVARAHKGKHTNLNRKHWRLSMRRIGIAIVAAAAIAFAGLGVSIAQTGPTYNRGWSQMMMGPMAGCPMGAGGQSMMGPYMMGGYGGQGMMGGYGGGMMGPGMMGAYGGPWSQGPASVAPQLDALRSTLAITHNQQSAWDAYAAAARADTQSMFDMHNRMIGFMQGQATSAPDWLHAHRDMMRTRADSLAALSGAVDRLYEQLDAGQKAAFDRYGGGMCGAW
jgi:hypothetical protein